MPRRMFNREPIRKETLWQVIEAMRHIVMTPEQRRAKRRLEQIVDSAFATESVSPIHHPCCEKGRV
jgi:hypothetical protein